MRLRTKYQEKEYIHENISSEFTIAQVKEIVGGDTGVDSKRIKLICMGKVLKDNNALADYPGIQDNVLMHMVVKEPELPAASSSVPNSSNNTSARTPNFADASSPPLGTDAGSGGNSSTPPPSSGANRTSGTAGAADAEAGGSGGGAPPDVANIFNLVGGMLGGMAQNMNARSAAGSSASSDEGTPNPAGNFANIFANLGQMAANARASREGAAGGSDGGSSGGTSTSTTTTSTQRGPGGATFTTETSYTTRTNASSSSPGGSASPNNSVNSSRATTNSSTVPGTASAASRPASSVEEVEEVVLETTATPSGGCNKNTTNTNTTTTASGGAPSTTTGATTTAAAAGALAPAVAGIHVHVHVTLDELEGLPVKLQKFSQQVPFAQIHVDQKEALTNEEDNQLKEQPSATDRASAVFQNMRPAMARVVEGANHFARGWGRGGGAVNDFYRNDDSAASATTTAPKRQNESDVVEEEATDEDNILGGLAKDVKASLQMPDYMSLLSGNWSPTAKIHPILQSKIVERTKTSTPSDAQLRSLAVKGASRIAARLRKSDHPLAGKIPKQNDFGDTISQMESVMQYLGYELITRVQTENPQEFAANARAFVVRSAGSLYGIAETYWFNGSTKATDEFIQDAVNYAMSSDTAQADPMMATMGPMIKPLVLNQIRQWAAEYRNSGSDSEDVQKTFERLALTPLLEAAGGTGAPRSAVAPSSSTTTGAAPKVEEPDLDDMLEEVVLEQQRNGSDQKKKKSSADTAMRHLVSCLSDIAVSEAESKALMETIEGGFYNNSNNGSSSSSELFETVEGEAYNSLYKKDE